MLGCSPGGRATDGPGPGDAEADAPLPPDACTGLECQVVPCERMGRPTTSVSGMIHAPNGTLPLYGVTVYVPNSDPGELEDGVKCTNCAEQLPGTPITRAISNELGRFTIANVPSGVDIPLIITVGKWRRRITIPSVTACTDNPVDPELTRLPKNKAEGDIPKIALVAGSCDALECLPRKLGIADSEFTSDSGDGRIHLYTANGVSSLSNGSTLAAATTLWSNLDKMKQYDIMLYGCECSRAAAGKPLASMLNLKAYADAGGRAFLSHYHNVWIVGQSASQQPPVWPSIAQCSVDSLANATAVIDEVNNPKGPSFALWMQYVMGSTIPGRIPILEPKRTCTSIDNTKAERWIHSQNTTEPQIFQFTTPNEAASNARCGKIVFSDMHVASGSTSTNPFPNGCSNQPLSPQEKALAFMFFDIAACVEVIQ